MILKNGFYKDEGIYGEKISKFEEKFLRNFQRNFMGETERSSNYLVTSAKLVKISRITFRRIEKEKNAIFHKHFWIILERNFREKIRKSQKLQRKSKENLEKLQRTLRNCLFDE